MAVGTGFNSPETQAAIAAQAAATGGQDDTMPNVDSVNEPVVEEVVEEPEVPSKTEDQSTTTEPAKQQTPDELDKLLADNGFNPEDLGKELANNEGKLTAETIAALKEKFNPEGVDKAVADLEKAFEGKAAEKRADVDTKNETINKSILEMNDYIYGSLAGGDVVKGKENLATLSEWAKENIPADELDAINTLLASGKKSVVKHGLEMAVNKWKKGTENKMMTGDSNVNLVPKPAFQPMSRDEFTELMKTEKYQKDPEYARTVDDRRNKTIAQGAYFTPEYSAYRRPLR